MRLAVIIKKNSIQHQVQPREVLRYAPAEESRINFYIEAVLEPGLVFPVDDSGILNLEFSLNVGIINIKRTTFEFIQSWVYLEWMYSDSALQGKQRKVKHFFESFKCELCG